MVSLGAAALIATPVGAQAMPAPIPITADYYSLQDSRDFGIGFLADQRTLFVGGCRVFDLASRSFSANCRYPQDTRWGYVSSDGTLLLATAVEAKTSKAWSYQIDALSGAIMAKRIDIEFSPPIAIHPSNAYWGRLLPENLRPHQRREPALRQMNDA